MTLKGIVDRLGAMKLYQVCQKNFEFLGLIPNQPRCNQKSVTTFLILTLTFTLDAVFLFFKANTFLEYTQNAYITTTVFAAWIGFIIMVLQKQKLFELIDHMEKYGDESEYHEN